MITHGIGPGAKHPVETHGGASSLVFAQNETHGRVSLPHQGHKTLEFIRIPPWISVSHQHHVDAGW
jgi:hypothetical protein